MSRVVVPKKSESRAVQREHVRRIASGGRFLPVLINKGVRGRVLPARRIISLPRPVLERPVSLPVPGFKLKPLQRVPEKEINPLFEDIDVFKNEVLQSEIGEVIKDFNRNLEDFWSQLWFEWRGLFIDWEENPEDSDVQPVDNVDDLFQNFIKRLKYDAPWENVWWGGKDVKRITAIGDFKGLGGRLEKILSGANNNDAVGADITEYFDDFEGVVVDEDNDFVKPFVPIQLPHEFWGIPDSWGSGPEVVVKGVKNVLRKNYPELKDLLDSNIPLVFLTDYKGLTVIGVPDKFAGLADRLLKK